MRERITRGMLDRQLEWFAENHPAPEGLRWFLERHNPGDHVYWRLCIARTDGKGGVHDSAITSRWYSTREMFDVLYFANRCHGVENHLKTIAQSLGAR